MASSRSTSTARAAADPIATRARVAVAVLFVVNGLTIANVVPWLPSIKDELSLSNTALGLAWAAGPLGGLAVGAAAGPLVARFGSGRTATRSALLGILVLPAVAFAPTWPMFAASLLLLGAADAVTDAAMNAHGLRVQRRYRRSIINSFHASWSMGAVAGGLVGAGLVALGVPRATHLTVTAALLACAVLVTARWQLAGPENAERTDAPVELPAAADAATRTAATVDTPVGTGTVHDRPVRAAEAHKDSGGGVRQAVRTAPWLLLGLAAIPMMGGAVEDSAASWAAVHLRDTLGATAFVAGLGFVAAQAMMVLGRITGDRLVDRFGAARVARSGSLLAAVGMLSVVVGTSPAMVIAGFGMAGLGVATLFPLGLAAAGEIPGVRSADGVAVASWLARLSFLAVPPVVGLVADTTSLRWGLATVLVCALIAAALSGLLPDDTAA